MTVSVLREAALPHSEADQRLQLTAQPDLSVLIPVLNERDNVSALLPRLLRVLNELGCTYEILVVDGGSCDGTVEVARRLGAQVLVQRSPGYGCALREGFAAAAGQYVLTLDADLSHDPDFIGKLWRARSAADIVIASRYVTGGVAYMPLYRKLLSRILNRFFGLGLGLPVRDLSSGLRLYRGRVLADLALDGRNFEIVEEVLVKAYSAGWRVIEIPFTYYPRHRGASHARIVRFGVDLLLAFARLWALRRSAASADYDERAFYSRWPRQRYRQRRRHRLITTMARGTGRVLDVGCGSSVILQSLNNAVGLDSFPNKLRYMRRYGTPLVCGSALALPLRDASFGCVVCADARPDRVVFGELMRVLRPGGVLILETAGSDSVVRPDGITLDELAAQYHLESLERAHIFNGALVWALRRPRAGDPIAPPPRP